MIDDVAGWMLTTSLGVVFSIILMIMAAAGAVRYHVDNVASTAASMAASEGGYTPEVDQYIRTAMGNAKIDGLTVSPAGQQVPTGDPITISIKSHAFGDLPFGLGDVPLDFVATGSATSEPAPGSQQYVTP